MRSETESGTVLPVANLTEYFRDALHGALVHQHVAVEDQTEQYVVNMLTLFSRTEQLHASTPAGRVPVLRHGELVIWESIAIGEYLCELAGKGLPPERAARARARSVSAEMHSGFQALRAQWPMNARALGRRTAMSAALQGDITRIDHIWCECRGRYGAGGPWLFGDYSLADAMYAPVVLRFRTYGAQLSGSAQQYMTTALADGALQAWVAAATAEPWTIAADEAGA